MTVEDLQHNGNQFEENDKAAEGAQQETVALSVQDRRNRQPLKFKTSDHAYPGQRPVEASHLNVLRTFSAVGGQRPITQGETKFSGSMIVSGKRPISASHLKISETYVVMGNRPVAANDIDDPTTLMGFLD